MSDIIKISGRISYIKATDKPLSSDVGIFYGDKYTWLFDLGASDETAKTLDLIKNPKNAVISHFHPDHRGNLEHAVLNELFLSANTFKYAKKGSVIEDKIIDDGEKIHIFSLPSSHAKGSLGMEIGDYAFLGDAIYPTMKNGVTCYNSSVLKEEIAVLKNLSAKYFLISHDEKFIYPKDEIISRLECIYSKRDPKQSYIAI